MQGLRKDEVLGVEYAGAIATLTLNRPQSNNAINDTMRSRLLRAFEDIRTNDAIQAVVLTGTGDDAFSVGHDIEEIATLTAMEAEAAAKRGLMLHRRIAELDKPVIAAIKGACLGAGFELALHCDIRLARADARFGFPGINVGLTSSGSALARLQRVAGIGSATALALTGGMVSAERAFMLGLVSNVAGDKDFDLAVQQLAVHLTTLSPIAIVETKRMLRMAAEQGVTAAAAQGPQSLAACYAQGGAADRLRVLFGGPGPEATVH
jgi:enoyl-CoA hydratase/carnithine racemase